MSDVTISYLVEPLKMPELYIEGIRLEPEEVAALRKEIEENYAEISRLPSGRFTFRSKNADRIQGIEFEYKVRKHESSGRDRSIYFHAHATRIDQHPIESSDNWNYICKLTDKNQSLNSIDFPGGDFSKELADPMLRYALLGKLLTASLQGGIDPESIGRFKQIVSYLSLIDRDIESIEHTTFAIVSKLNSQKPKHWMTYGKKSPCRCNIFRYRS
jgi:hypothetical protein